MHANISYRRLINGARASHYQACILRDLKVHIRGRLFEPGRGEAADFARATIWKAAAHRLVLDQAQVSHEQTVICTAIIELHHCVTGVIIDAGIYRCWVLGVVDRRQS